MLKKKRKSKTIQNINTPLCGMLLWYVKDHMVCMVLCCKLALVKILKKDRAAIKHTVCIQGLGRILFLLPDYPACLAGYCRISNLFLPDDRISGRIIRNCRISGPTLVHTLYRDRGSFKDMNRVLQFTPPHPGKLCWCEIEHKFMI